MYMYKSKIKLAVKVNFSLDFELVFNPFPGCQLFPVMNYRFSLQDLSAMLEGVSGEKGGLMW